MLTLDGVGRLVGAQVGNDKQGPATITLRIWRPAGATVIASTLSQPCVKRPTPDAARTGAENCLAG